MGQATFSGNSHYQIDVDAALVSQNGNSSTIYWRVIVIKTGSFGNSAWGNTGSKGWADSNRAGANDLWANNNIQFNFQNGSQNGNFTMAEGTFVVNHNADGTGSYHVSAGLTLMSLGSASAGTGIRSLPRTNVKTVPGKPVGLSVDQATSSSLRFRFSGTTDGGSPIREWQIHYGANPTFGEFAIASDGTSIIGALTPGKTYYFWARGRNDIGWGPFSDRMSGKTLAGLARIRVNGVWKNATPYVKVNGVWKIAQPYVKVSGAWKTTN